MFKHTMFLKFSNLQQWILTCDIHIAYNKTFLLLPVPTSLIMKNNNININKKSLDFPQLFIIDCIIPLHRNKKFKKSTVRSFKSFIFTLFGPFSFVCLHLSPKTLFFLRFSPCILITGKINLCVNSLVLESKVQFFILFGPFSFIYLHLSSKILFFHVLIFAY